jgi:hypothetical protein
VRKRVVIGVLVAATVIAVIAFVNRPDGDSIEYHRMSYIAASEGWVWDQKLANKARKVFGQKSRWHPVVKRMDYHERALIRLGYLEERIVVVSNCPPKKAHVAVYKAAYDHDPTSLDPEFLRVLQRGTNMLRVVGLTKDIARWEEAARKADVPENGN